MKTNADVSNRVTFGFARPLKIRNTDTTSGLNSRLTWSPNPRTTNPATYDRCGRDQQFTLIAMLQ